MANDHEWLAKRFDENREHLRAVAFRLLGSTSEAEDAIQEAWLKVDRADRGDIENLTGWLTTIVARVCLDMLRSRVSKREDSSTVVAEIPSETNPENELAFAEAIGPALLIVLEMLTPPERIAFVLHDMFDLSFEEIAPIIDRKPAAVRQLASRARRRVRGSKGSEADVERHRELVSAFFSAARDGNFERLVAVLDPEIVLRADEAAVRTATANKERGAPPLASEIRGAKSVADTFKGRAGSALAALIDGDAGAVWAFGEKITTAFIFSFEQDKITGLDLVMDPETLSELEMKIERK